MTNLLHEKALSLAKTYLRTELELVEVLQQIDKHKVYNELGYSSLYDYCLKALDLSPSQSSAFVGIARKSVELPELKEALVSGVLNVSKAKRVLKVIDSTNVALWIEKAATLPQKQVEREVAQTNPELAIQDRIKPVSVNQAELRCGVSYETEQHLDRVRELLSQKLGHSVTLQEAIAYLAKGFVEKNDPIKKAERHATKQENKTSKPGTTLLRSVPDPRFLPADLVHQINLRDRGQCRHKMPEGTRCGSKQFLHFHHIIPVAKGGQSTLENLITVCSAHHRRIHEQDPEYSRLLRRSAPRKDESEQCA